MTTDSVWTSRYLSICPICGLHYTHDRKGKKTCSDACRNKLSRVARGRAANRHDAQQRAVLTKASKTNEFTCPVCGKTFRRDGPSSNVMYCSDACKMKAFRSTEKGHLSSQITAHKRRVAIKSSVSISTDELMRLREIQEDKCIYCLTDLHGKGHLDHIAPLSKGGDNDYNNVALACEDCNHAKSAKSVDKYAAQIGLPIETLVMRLAYIQVNLRPPIEPETD